MKFSVNEVILASVAILLCVIVDTVRPATVPARTKSKYPEVDGIAFPENTELANKNKKDRIPLYVPGRCPVNQLLYPGDQESDWICDCQPSYIYYPMDDTCHAAYRRGPCQKGQYLILPKNQVIPRCDRNPCRTDNKVPFKNACHELDKAGGPCEQNGGIVSLTLGIDPATLQPACLKGDSALHLVEAPQTACNPGSKRDHNGSCRPEFG